MKKNEELQLLLQSEKGSFAPVIEALSHSDQLVIMDFSTNNRELSTINLVETETFSQFIFDKLYGGKTGVGGYLEDRVIYRRSPHYDGDEPRHIHLGIDIWQKEGTEVYAPLAGKVHSFANNLGFGNYGPTIILEHHLQNITFFTLYGHLSIESLTHIFTGRAFKKGEQIAALGNFPENGDWPPHLHFQVMTDLLGAIGDFPGVASPTQLLQLQEICINPNLILNIAALP